MPLAPVFLSASVPDPNRDPEYFTTADTVAIRDAVIALTKTVLPKTEFVFGGHPAITPMVAWVAHNSDAFSRVHMYQSKFFRENYIADIEKFRYIEIPAVDRDRDASLEAMRTAMLEQRKPFSAAFFIGGMEGIEAEYALAAKLLPDTPRYPIASTGSAALKLWRLTVESPNEAAAYYRDEFFPRLREQRSYTALFTEILRRREEAEASFHAL